MPLIPLKNRDVTIKLIETQIVGAQGSREILTPGAGSVTVAASPGTVTTVVTKQFKLVGVQNVTIDRSQDIGQSNGLTTSFLQPWYFKPVTVTISGKSYLGAYALNIVNISADRTRDNMLDLITTLQRIQGDPGRKIELIFGDESFMGYIFSFRHKEDVQNPYLLDYDVSFIGQEIINSSITDGLNNALADKSILFSNAIAPVIKFSEVFLP